MPTDAGHGLGERGHRVVGVPHRSVPGVAARGQPHPGHPLLRGLDEVEPAVPHRRGEAADLADGVRAVLEPLAVRLHQRSGALVPPGLLVGGEAEHQRPVGHDAGPGTGTHRGEQHRVEVLHVDGTATPELTLVDLPAERVQLPVGGVGGDDVEVAVHEDRVAPVPAPARQHVGAPRLGLPQLALDADLVEQRRHVLGGLALARARLVAEVGRVDADQVTADLRDLGCGVVVGVLSGGAHGPHSAAAGAVVESAVSDPAGTPAQRRWRAPARGLIERVWAQRTSPPAATTPSCRASAIGSALRGLPRPGVLPALLEDLDLEDDGARDGPLDGALAPCPGRRAVRPPALDHDLFEAVLLGYTHLQPAQARWSR